MSTPNQPPRRRTVRDLTGGNWLKLQEIEFEDHAGKRRVWEAASRRHQQGAVMVIARLRPSGRYVFVEQYRPPADRHVLEFPAGLIDAGEKPEVTALRELREETGYHGVLRWCSGMCLSSPGMSGEGFYQVLADVDETLPANRHPVTQWEESEQIVTHLVAPGDVAAFLRAREAAGVLLDSKVVAYFLGAGVEW